MHFSSRLKSNLQIHLITRLSPFQYNLQPEAASALIPPHGFSLFHGTHARPARSVRRGCYCLPLTLPRHPIHNVGIHLLHTPASALSQSGSAYSSCHNHTVHRRPPRQLLSPAAFFPTLPDPLPPEPAILAPVLLIQSATLPIAEPIPSTIG